MTSRLLTPLRRLRAMDREEVQFRAGAELHKLTGRVRAAVAQAGWKRTDLLGLLSPSAVSSQPLLATAIEAGRRRDWAAAHRSLASHVALRPSAFPLDPTQLPALAGHVRRRFPDAAAAAAAQADRILAGRYDLLGYHDVDFGSPPRWHHDPIHATRSPLTFWADVPYLDPSLGDHKIVWEINRHQHWIALGRAFTLTGDRRYYREFVRQLEDWLQANPPLRGTNWASMLELAFRALSWLWALHFFAPAAAEDPPDGAPWTVDLLIALDRQLSHIEQNLSRYFSPNTHLTGEALALYVAGRALPELRLSAARAALGKAVLAGEVGRQINGDGGHAELSSHYHRYSTDFYLLALSAARVSHDADHALFEDAAHRQARYLRALTTDAGRLPLIGDDDGGQLFPICGREPADCRDTLAAAALILDAPELAVSGMPEEVWWRCGSEGVAGARIAPRSSWPSTALPDSGYYVLRTPRHDHLVFDAGRHGFLNGGHAHADALSVVLTVDGRPLLTDPGTATYTMDGAMRDRFRSTQMHNTVAIDGRGQSIPRGPFHWQSTTDARATFWYAHPDLAVAEGRHEGYAPVTHVRTVIAAPIGWFFVDHLFAHVPETGTVTAAAFWHLHPDWRVVARTPHAATLRHTDGTLRSLATSASLQLPQPDEELDLFAPAYGSVQRATCLRGDSDGPVPRAFATFVPGAAGVTDLALEPLSLTAPPGDHWHGAAFLATWTGGEALLLSATPVSPVGDAEAADAPLPVWGCRRARTDARIALWSRAGDQHPLLVGGRRFQTDDLALTV